MTIKNIREEVIKEFIAAELLDDNVFPTLDLVCAIALRDYKNTDVFASILHENLSIEYGEPASISKFNQIIKNTDIDINTLYRFIDFLSHRITDQKFSIQQKLNSVSIALKNLNQKIHGLILLNEDSTNISNTYVIDFSKLDDIDLEQTTALIDTSKKEVSIKNKNLLGSNNTAFIKTIDATCVTPRYIRFSNLTGHPIQKLYDGNEDTMGIYEVLMPPTHKGYVDIRIKVVFAELVSFNHVYLKMQPTNTVERFEASVMAYIDNSWKTISDYQLYDSNIDTTFDVISTKDLVVNIRLGSYNVSAEGLVYRFFGKELVIDTVNYDGTEIVMTKDLAFSPKFNVIGLRADAIIPENCSVDHYVSYTLSWMNGNVLELFISDFIKIDSSNYLKILSNEQSILSTHGVDLTYTHPYNYGKNITFSYTSDLFPSLNLSTSKLIRNIDNFGIDQDQNNFCYFYLYDEQNIDFNSIPGFLDGELVEVSQKVTPGIHKFYLLDKNNTGIYQAYFNENDIIFGSYVSSYLDPQEFINIAEDDDYTWFTIIKAKDLNNNDKYIVIAKEISITEFMGFVQQQITIDPRAIDLKVKSVLKGNGEQTPIIKNIKIKVG